MLVLNGEGRMFAKLLGRRRDEMRDLLDLIVCTKCKTRVEYHDDRDGFMSCECWVRQTRDEPMPYKWIEVEDRKANPCGMCGKDINERLVFRCADCGLPFHQACLDQHCKHGNQKQELRSENMFLKQHVKNLEESMLKGVAFRDELQSEVERLMRAIEWAGENGDFPNQHVGRNPVHSFKTELRRHVTGA